MSYTLVELPGHEWIGKVPKEWKTDKFKYLFRVSTEKNGNTPVGEMLSVSGYRGIEIKEYEDDTQKRTTAELEDYRVVRPNQLVVNTMWLNYAGLGVSEFTGHVSPAYRSYYIDSSMWPRYVHHLMRSEIYVRGYTKFMQGIRPNSLQIKTDDFNAFPILIPPMDEQQKIASFLDHETAKIDILVDKQQQLIKLLKEKRQAVISHAVIKGLDPDAPMKDSGVAWLGEVPKGWDVLPIRRFVDKIEQGVSPLASNYPPGISEEGVLKISAVKKGIYDELQSKTLDSKTPMDSRYQIKKGDLLVTRANTPQLVADTCVVISEPKRKIMLCDLIYRLNTNNKVRNDFLCLCLLSDKGRLQIELDARGSSMTMAKVAQEHIKSWIFPMPPLKEQAEIVNFISKQTTKIDGVLEKSKSGIDLLKERRTALISASVTGKIDVRNWQPGG